MKIKIAVTIGRRPTGSITWQADGSGTSDVQRCIEHTRECIPVEWPKKSYVVVVDVPEEFGEVELEGEVYDARPY